MARTRTAPPQPGFDVLVLTVANRVQRRFAERMLELRRRLGALPAGLRTIVIADPAGKRVGSGGSTLLAIERLRRDGLLRGRRVLVLHSGGDSRRLPSWSAVGKIWIPLGRRGRGIGPLGQPALFDLVLAELSRLRLPAPGGVVVASGDAALRLVGNRVRLDGRGAAVLAFPGDAARAARHGVFVLGRGRRVRRTLQKPTAAELRAAGAVDRVGRAWIDSGIFFLPPAAAQALLRGARGMLPSLARGTESLDLYQEIAEAMSADATPASFAARFPRTGLRARRLGAFFRAAHAVALRAEPLAAGRFLHLGSTRELRERLASDEPERLFPDLLRPRRAPGDGSDDALPAVALRDGASCCTPHGIDDDCKTAAESGGTVCGRPLAALPARSGLGARAIWGNHPRTLWFARIHPVADDPRTARDLARWIAAGGKAPPGWRRARRASFAELMSLADPEAAADAVSLALVGEAVATDVPRPQAVRRLRLRPGEAASAHAPVRVDLAGGWSDTPPLCMLHGGSVVNMALALEGARPVRATARVTAEPAITLHSEDAGRRARYQSVRELLDHRDPSRWDALARAALVLSGLVPHDPEADLREHLRRIGGGLRITLSSAVPHGSGLGTSSILGAALLAALDRAAGRAHDPRRIARDASLLEQMIGSRGGWQDQAGGLWGGIKLCTTRAGARQVPTVRPLRAPRGFVRAIEDRGILLFSGRRRMARGILETVVLRYLGGEPAVLDARARLVAGAHLLADAVRAGDIGEFAARVNEYRRLKAIVDPASMTAELERPVRALGKDVAAWTFAGAGGGGFVFMLAPSAEAAARIRDRLRRRPPHPDASVHAVRIDPRGLDVTVA